MQKLLVTLIPTAAQLEVYAHELSVAINIPKMSNPWVTAPFFCKIWPTAKSSTWLSQLQAVVPCSRLPPFTVHSRLPLMDTVAAVAATNRTVVSTTAWHLVYIQWQQ